MNKTHYKLALKTAWKAFVIFFKSWSITLNRLLLDVLNGIAKHWIFAIILVIVYVIMFVKMAQSRANYHYINKVNYHLSQSLDSCKTLMEKR